MEPITKGYDILLKIEEPAETMHTNQTDAFPIMSIKGKRYAMVTSQVDGNIIVSKATKKRTAGEMVAGYRKIMKHFKRANIVVKHTPFG